MGSSKAALDWHGSTLLRRVTGLAQRTVDGPVVVVRAPGQELPATHPAVEVVSDAREGRGPLEGLAAGLSAADRLKPGFLFERCRVCRLDDAAMLRDAALAAADPELLSVRNLNEPGDYADAHALPAPEIEVRRPGALARNGAPRGLRVSAWSLGQLADAIGLVLDESVLAALNGDPIAPDRELPLAARDAVAFTVADPRE